MGLEVTLTQVEEMTKDAITKQFEYVATFGLSMDDEDIRIKFAQDVADSVRHGMLMTSSQAVLDMCAVGEARRQRVRDLMAYHGLNYADAKDREARESSVLTDCSDHETEGKCINCGLPADG